LIDPINEDIPANRSAISQNVWPFNEPGVAHLATVRIG